MKQAIASELFATVESFEEIVLFGVWLSISNNHNFVPDVYSYHQPVAPIDWPS